jgi:magnesium transporter
MTMEGTAAAAHVASAAGGDAGDASTNAVGIHSSFQELPISSILYRNNKRSVGIHIRDLLTLSITESSGPNQNKGPLSSRKDSPVILPRGDAVLVNFGHVKAICWASEAMLFEVKSPAVTLLAAELEEELRVNHANRAHPAADSDASTENFELVFLEETLKDVCDTWHRRVKLYKPVVDGILTTISAEAMDSASDSGMHRLIPLKENLASFELTVKSHIRCLVDLLESDEDMRNLLLTERQEFREQREREAREDGGSVYHAQTNNTSNSSDEPDISIDRHQVVELLIEDYSRQLQQILQSINFLQNRVQSTQELVAMSLDAYRNRMIEMNLHLTIGAVCLGACTTVAGFFGMNLTSGLEEHAGLFWPTVWGSSAVGVAIYVTCRSYLSGKHMQNRALQRANEVRSVTGVLSDMDSLDYAVKRLVEAQSLTKAAALVARQEAAALRDDGGGGDEAEDEFEDGVKVGREEFRRMLESGRAGRAVPDGELKLIFDILDASGDGVLHENEFKTLSAAITDQSK